MQYMNSHNSNNTDAWITLEEARLCSYGQVEWWNVRTDCVKVPSTTTTTTTTKNQENTKPQHHESEQHELFLEPRQYHPHGPSDRPVWVHGTTWLYLGEWNVEEDCPQGRGIYYFVPNGRVLVCESSSSTNDNTTSKDDDNCTTEDEHSFGTLFWLPTCPVWDTNELEGSPIACSHDSNKGVPYIYVGQFINGEKHDVHAKVILKDGTTKMGPFENDWPVGDWWKDHTAQPLTSPEELQALMSFEAPKTNIEFGLEEEDNDDDDDDDDDLQGTWLTLEQARDRSYGRVAWWKCPSPDGEFIEERQYHPDGPLDHPVWWDQDSDCLYLGEWQDDCYHGNGVVYFPNGRVYRGSFDQGCCSGTALLTWLTQAPLWKQNHQPQSAIQSSKQFGLPYIYLGRFVDSEKDDPFAKVVLKDGTMRVGPFRNDEPVGNWWKDHEKLPPDQEVLKQLLDFGTETNAEETVSTTRAAVPNNESNVTTVSPNETWLSLAQAQNESYGRVEWWKCPGPNGELVPEQQLHPGGPKDKPIWKDANGWMYLGSFRGKTYHGELGVLHFPNGRVYVGQFERNQCVGLAKLVWLPAAPAWRDNQHASSAILASSQEDAGGVPYIYIGHFVQSERNDPRAKVILKDGTTRIGPFEKNVPVGNWWKDHELKAPTSDSEMSEILSFGRSAAAAPALGGVAGTNHTNTANNTRSSLPSADLQPDRIWLTFKEARKRAFGNAEWWKCPGIHGQTVPEKQHCPHGPADHPICLESNGWMYFGGWKNRDYDGFGVLYFPNGRVYVGQIVDKECVGPAKLLWLPRSPNWIKNEQPKSSIFQSPTVSVGVPYIYLGGFQQSQRCDEKATVILKDGTTRVGPFDHDKPVGDWWKDHKPVASKSKAEMLELLAFAAPKKGFLPKRFQKKFLGMK